MAGWYPSHRREAAIIFCIAGLRAVFAADKALFSLPSEPSAAADCEASRAFASALRESLLSAPSVADTWPLARPPPAGASAGHLKPSSSFDTVSELASNADAAPRAEASAVLPFELQVCGPQLS